MEKILCPPYIGAKASDVSQVFGVLQSFGGTHTGVDFAPSNAYGKFLLAPELCEVAKIVTDETFDNDFYPRLERGYGIVLQSLISQKRKFLYWHCCQAFPVRVGQIIQQGAVVAQIGNSGMCYSGGVYVPLKDRASRKGSHLHYEMRISGKEPDYDNVLPMIDFSFPVRLDVKNAAKQTVVAMLNLILNRK
jgi:hypothetical protein